MSGETSQSEVARLAEVDRQMVRYRAPAAGLDLALRGTRAMA